MLKARHYTTPLVSPEERPPLVERKIKKPSLLRIVWIMAKVPQLLINVLALKYSKRMTAKGMAVEIRHYFEDLGGIWIKLGQVLALRNDLFSNEFCNELSQLQDRAFAFPSERSVAIIRENIKDPIEEVFDYFEAKPFAAASLSQVHKARLRKNRRWVAIKVQRPYAREYFRYDFRWLSWLFGLINFCNILTYVKWHEMLAEVETMMEEELDYRSEASDMKKLRKTLKKHKVYVPHVVFKYSTETVLVMEYLQGVFMSDFMQMRRNDPERLAAWLKENRIDPAVVASRLFRSLMRQLYEDRIFHGDLHPGNIVMLRNSRVAFIDFGNTGLFDPEFAAKYDQYSRAMASGSAARSVDLFLVLSNKIPPVDIVPIRNEMIRSLQRFQKRASIKSLPFEERSLAASSAELNRIAMKHGIDFNWKMLRIGRTFGTMDLNIAALDPSFDYRKESQKYHKAARREAQDEAKLLGPAQHGFRPGDAGFAIRLRKSVSLRRSGRVRHTSRGLHLPHHIPLDVAWAGCPCLDFPIPTPQTMG